MNSDTSNDSQKNKFSAVRRVQSFNHAGRGIWLFLKTTHNAWIHTFIFICVVVAGFVLHISHSDWISIMLAGGLVFVAEAINTAIEIDIDLTSPTYHPYARDTKDVAAGAVLIASIIACVVGALVFLPYIL